MANFAVKTRLSMWP